MSNIACLSVGQTLHMGVHVLLCWRGLQDHFREYVLVSLGQKIKNTNQAFKLRFVFLLKLAGRDIPKWGNYYEQ